MDRIMFLGLAILCVAGCAASGTVTETRALQGDFSAYASVGVYPQPNAEVDKKDYSSKLGQAVAAILRDEKVFATVSTDVGEPVELAIQPRFTEIDEANGAVAVFASSAANSTVEVACEFVASQSKSTIGAITVEGDSKDKGRSEVFGLGVTSSADYTERAIQNAASLIVDYIMAHRPAAAE